MRAHVLFAEEVRHVLVWLSGQQTKRARPVTATAVLAGLPMLSERGAMSGYAALT